MVSPALKRRSSATTGSEAGARPLQGALEAWRAEGFEQVVHGVGVEGAHGILIVGGDENHRRHLLRPNCLDDTKAIYAGHLHVEEDEIGHLVLNRSNRLRTVATLTDHLDILLLLEEREHSLPSDRLVVDNQGTDPAHATLSIGFSALATRDRSSDSGSCPIGMTIVTRRQPPDGV